ncbi:MAG: hypothetical protein MSH18_00865 [Bacteroidales bacterium]|nr:hypothetical protein [Bacteroidales bacterium]
MRKVMVMFGLCVLFFGIKVVGQTLTPKDTLAFRQCLSVEMWPQTDILLYQKMYQDIGDNRYLMGKFYWSGDAHYDVANGDISNKTVFPYKSYTYNFRPVATCLKEQYTLNLKEKADLEKAKQALVEKLKTFDENSDNKPLFFADIKLKYNGDYAKYVDALIENSMATNKGRLKKFLPRHRAKWLTTDMGFQFTLGLALYEMAVREMRTQGKE